MAKELKMAIKDLWAQTGKWLRSRKLFSSGNSRPEVDDEGLISQDAETTKTADAQGNSPAGQSDNLVVQAVPQKGTAKINYSDRLLCIEFSQQTDVYL
ncbi:MAG: hypothetical protein FVQ84_19870 [Planctomycetes bacterium]|nr:hypothetical protein [Planctomycetota bacterium]